MPTKLSISMPLEAAKKIKADPAAFMAYLKQNGFDITDIQFPKWKVTRVAFFASESPNIKGRLEYNSMAEANAFIQGQEAEARWRKGRGEMLGYYKTDFLVTFEDGSHYQGRFDIGSEDGGNLTDHITQFCRCYSGRFKPSHMRDSDWESFKKTFVPTDAATYYGNILDCYDLNS